MDSRSWFLMDFPGKSGKSLTSEIEKIFEQSRKFQPIGYLENPRYSGVFAFSEQSVLANAGDWRRPYHNPTQVGWARSPR